jgi:predicted Zn finger-like uncharacterized protein
MKAKCPNCEAVYQLDDSKIPKKGVMPPALSVRPDSI